MKIKKLKNIYQHYYSEKLDNLGKFKIFFSNSFQPCNRDRNFGSYVPGVEKEHSFRRMELYVGAKAHL